MLPNEVLVKDQNFTIIDKDSLCDEISKYKKEGYRLSTITCESLGQEEFELTYHLDLNYELKNIRVVGKYSEPMISISSIFPSALLHENEYQDLFGIKFDGLIIDYKGNLYIHKNAPQNPLR